MFGKKKLIVPNQLKNDLDASYDDMYYSDMDIVIILDGKEGTGKSYTARVVGAYFSHITGISFNSENIHFTTDDYIKSSENGKKYQINILDEGRQALNKKRSMSKSNVKFTNWLSENRDKNQIHIIILPAIHDLDSYISIWRMTFLIHHLKVHIKSNVTRSGYRLVHGYFKVYDNGKDLQNVIFKKHKYGYYSYPFDYKYRRKITSKEAFNDTELNKYKLKKAEKRKAKYEEVEKISPFKKHLISLIKDLRKGGRTQKDIGKIMGVNRAYVSQLENKEVSVNA